MKACAKDIDVAIGTACGHRPIVVLTESQVADLIDPVSARNRLRETFDACGAGGTGLGQRLGIATIDGGGSMIIAPGLAAGIPAYTIKLHPTSKGEDPAHHGVLLLHDLETGALLAVMGATHLTAVRTGLAGALAADALATPEARTAAVIGAGRQGAFLLGALVDVRPIDRVFVFDVHERRAAAFANRQSEELGIEVESVGSVEEAARDADVVLTATWAREAFLHAGMVKQGAHISAMGADEPGKREIHPSLLSAGRIIVDDARLVAQAQVVARQAVDAELGEVLCGRRQGRVSHEDITIFLGVGVPFQDLVIAWPVYERAAERGIGISVGLAN